MQHDSEKTTTPAASGNRSQTSDSDANSEPLLGVSSDSVTRAGEHDRGDDRTLADRVKTWLIGKPRDLSDTSIFKHLSLVAFLAWVGLGADGLSSSCYGPAEAFQNLGDHTYLAVFLAMMTIVTVLIISTCYSHIIEEFPSGGGGYLVASKLLGRRVGVVSGCALLVDYVLTITVSIAAAGDAIFGLLPAEWLTWKLPGEFAAIAVLIVLNLRGVKESVLALLPIFLLFLVTHGVLIVGAIALNLTAVGDVAHQVAEGVRSGINNPDFGFLAMLALLLHAYSLGAGTYTGIEAVSNSMPVLREPRVATGKRTMVYMGLSLALTAGGLVLSYLLLGIRPVADKTMNHALTESFVGGLGFGGHWFGTAFILATVLSEGALLVVAAQAGFIDGPRILANMAHDSWAPHWFGNLSERLAMHNGVLLMGGSALAALAYTQGNVTTLVIMYSINVFLTFSLSMLGMCRHWFGQRTKHALWRRRLALFVGGATLCLVILIVTIFEKFQEGAWRTLAVTGIAVALCVLIQRYYRRVSANLRHLDDVLSALPTRDQPATTEPDPQQPTAVILVGGYSGLGVHTLLNAIRMLPGYFKNMVFISVAVVDSGAFKGASAADELRKHTENSLGKYVDLARRLGMPATSFVAVGTDVVDELEQLCIALAKRYTRSIFFSGQLVFQQDKWYQRLLHNETAFSLQRRLQWTGVPMVILPTRVRFASETAAHS
jgi:amino acid transporter